MAGTIIPVISKREYDFSSGAATVVALRAVDVSRYTQGALLVRLHSEDISGVSTLDVIAKTAAPSAEEPDEDFIGSTEIAKVSFGATDTAPMLGRTTLASDFGGSLQITVVGTPATGNCKATISADLVLKE